MSNLYWRLRTLVQQVEAGEQPLYTLSTGERLAVSLVLNQVEWLRDQNRTALSAVDRIGTSWTQAAIAVQRDGWRAANGKDHGVTHA